MKAKTLTLKHKRSNALYNRTATYLETAFPLLLIQAITIATSTH